MLQDKFKEVVNTPPLWKYSLLGIPQFNLLPFPIKDYPEANHPNNLRLGKQIESFVDFELQSHPDITVLNKNIQIIHQKQTLGEIDFLIQTKGHPIHLEVVYKFYLYNPQVGSSELDHWIGPNNKDCLVYKLEKLKNKQLPLLYKEETQPYLQDLNLSAKDIKQYVYFKAQLFIPYLSEKQHYEGINPECINGFYITENQLNHFKYYSFYIPKKHDWILPPSLETNWMNHDQFKDEIAICKQNKQAPLCWIKSPKSELKKCFVYFEKEQ